LLDIFVNGYHKPVDFPEYGDIPSDVQPVLQFHVQLQPESFSTIQHVILFFFEQFFFSSFLSFPFS